MCLEQCPPESGTPGTSLPLDIRCFTSGEALIEESKYIESLDILYLDSDLGNGQMDGIECARQIRKKNRKVKFLFFSATPDMALASYEVKAENYILKSCLTKQFFLKQLDGLVRGEMQEHRRSLCKYNRRVDILDISEIMYVERMERKNRIGTQEREKYCSGRIEKNVQSKRGVEQALQGGEMIEIHKDFMRGFPIGGSACGNSAKDGGGSGKHVGGAGSAADTGTYEQHGGDPVGFGVG